MIGVSAMKQFLCELLFSCAVLGSGPPPIDELTYGTVLYEYYQQDYQRALLNTMVAESQDRRGADSVRFDLAAGSFAFADGMYTFAGDTFARVDPKEIDTLNRTRLAFHLGREFHRRQDWPQLAEQLAQIEVGEAALGREHVHPEVAYMRSELAVQRGQFDAAEQQLLRLQEADPLRAYGMFNLGVAYREADRLDDARRAFGLLAHAPAYADETFDLAQRAKLALALIARQAQQSASAASVLADVPGKGRYQEVAMAAYGGLAMDNEDYELAARIWMTLQEQDYWTPSTATAHLGFPLSLEGMAGQGHNTMAMALAQFQRAEETFSARLVNLQAFSQSARDPATIKELLEVFAYRSVNGEDAEADVEQMRELMQKWQAQLGHTDWLEWLATDNVNAVLTQWRELNAAEEWLQELPVELDALQGVAVEQRRRNGEASTQLRGDGMLAHREHLQSRLVAAQQRVDALRAAAPTNSLQWMWPIATRQERAMLELVADMRRLLAHQGPAERDKWSERLQRIEGVVFYRLVTERAARLQVLNGTYKSLQQQLADVDENIARVRSAETDFTGGVGTDFLAFLTRAERISAMVNGARQNRETLLANQILERVQRETRQVQQYLLVTRIAIARTTDQLAMATVEVGP